MYDSKNYTLYDIKIATGISKSTLYRYLDDHARSLSEGKD
ncbi:helix-turn-helix domain-containing protein [Ammoniphilus oxalaticus]|nr:helix-turn-helix domain-containing protein [Ammoniphilus oxalaticus]